jgi:hypothetical protein
MEMKIHLIPTDKPSRLIKNNLGYGIVSDAWKEFDINLIQGQYQNIYITSDEEIKEGDVATDGTVVGYYSLDDEGCPILKDSKCESGYSFSLVPHCKKIILTTDQDLIKEGIQSIDDDFLEWFVKNPSCEMVEVVFSNRGITGTEKILKTFGEYKIILPQEEPKQETLEEAAINYAHNYFNMHETNNYQALKQGFENGAKSDAAKDYWYKKFWEDYKSQFKKQNNEQ